MNGPKAARATRRALPAGYRPLVLLFCYGLLLAGCWGESAQRPIPLTVVVSGDTAGWIVPCGCASNQSGGLPRRATYWYRVQKNPGVVTLVVHSLSGRDIGVLGVLDEQFATDELDVAPPRQAILDTLDSAGRDLDAVIVLAYLPEEKLRQLAETLPEVDAIVGGPTGQPMPPVHVGPVLLTSATNQGKFLARLDLPAAEGQLSWTGRIEELDGSYEDEPAQVENLKRFYAELAERDFTPAETSFVESLLGNQSDFRFAGAESCRECHEEECRAWDESAHAHAFRSLQETGVHVDPDCQRCHTDGYGLPGGFTSVGRTIKRGNVGCESCHGPSKAHVDDPKVRTPHYRRAKDHCTGCHDRENSSQFELETYWDKIRHGEESP